MIGLSTLNGLARNYDRLTAEERARLILRADLRGDAGEETKLNEAGTIIELVIRDHTPAVLAFFDVAMLIRIELLETAGLFREMMVIDERRAERRRWARSRRRQKRTEKAAEPSREDPHRRTRDLVRAAGQLLAAKFHGWCLFCERIAVPAETGPPMGWNRLVRDVELAELVALKPVRGDELDPIVPQPPTASDFAEGVEMLYQMLRARWSGDEDDGDPGDPNSRPGVASSSTAMCR